MLCPTRASLAGIMPLNSLSIRLELGCIWFIALLNLCEAQSHSRPSRVFVDSLRGWCDSFFYCYLTHDYSKNRQIRSHCTRSGCPGFLFEISLAHLTWSHWCSLPLEFSFRRRTRQGVAVQLCWKHLLAGQVSSTEVSWKIPFCNVVDC